MSGGTIALYQGIPCVAVLYHCSRGWEPDVSYVDMIVPGFGSSSSPFRVETALPNEIRQEALQPIDEIAAQRALAAAKAGRFRPSASGLASAPSLQPSGTLILAEYVDGEEFVFVKHPLFVTAVEVLDRDSLGTFASPVIGEEARAKAPCTIRVYLADLRRFWNRGLARRWNWNRVLPDGTVDRSTVKPDGGAFTLAEVAEELGSYVFPGERGERRVRLSDRVKLDWGKDTGPQFFPAFTPATVALEAAMTERRLPPPSLYLDNTIGVFKVGEGKVGYALDGSHENTEDFPDKDILWRGGRGAGHRVDPTGKADYLVVKGPTRVATVQVDDWEAVIEIRGRFVPLVEGLRLLTNGTKDLVWLARMVLQPNLYRYVPGLSAEAVQILTRDAWRLWRVPDAVKYDGVDEEGFPLPNGFGPNANLLPLLNQADHINGKRLAPEIATYWFELQHHAYDGDTQVDRDIRVLSANLRALREQIAKQAQALGVDDPFGPESALEILGEGALAEELRKIDTKVKAQAREVIRAREVSEAQSNALKEAYRAYYRAQARRAEENGEEYTADIEFEKALLLAEIEAAAKEQDELLAGNLDPNLLAGPEEQVQQFADILKLLTGIGLIGEGVEDVVLGGTDARKEGRINRQIQITGARQVEFEELRRRQVERAEVLRRRREVNGGPAPKEISFLRNMRRRVDSRARIVSKEQGVIRTSRLAGWISEDGSLPARPRIGVQDGVFFVPMPVRVTFGATIQPRVDRAPPRRPVTGEQQQTPQEEEAERAANREVFAGDVATTGPFSPEAAAESALEREGRPSELQSPSDPYLYKLGGVVFSPRFMPGGENIIPDTLTEQETPTLVIFRRTGTGPPTVVEDIDGVPVGDGILVTRTEEEFRQLEFLRSDENGLISNRESVLLVARQIASDLLGGEDKVEAEYLILGRPWAVNVDGVVASVTIQMEPDGAGFTTTVRSGGLLAARPLLVSAAQGRRGPLGRDR